MKKLILLIAMVAICFRIVFSQGCLPEGITFTAQEQIDNFQFNYPGCTEIEGNVTISGEDITNLNGLGVITMIDGSLNVYLTSLTNLDGLNGLDSIGIFLDCTNNNLLSSLAGLNNLNCVGISFGIGFESSIN